MALIHWLLLVVSWWWIHYTFSGKQRKDIWTLIGTDFGWHLKKFSLEMSLTLIAGYQLQLVNILCCNVYFFMHANDLSLWIQQYYCVCLKGLPESSNGVKFAMTHYGHLVFSSCKTKFFSRKEKLGSSFWVFLARRQADRIRTLEGLSI